MGKLQLPYRIYYGENPGIIPEFSVISGMIFSGGSAGRFLRAGE